MNVINPLWLDKPYYSLDAFCKHHFGQKCYKIALNAGMTCPNRDGTLDTRGCIFCSAGGSGDFAVPLSHHIEEDLQQGIQHMGEKNIGNNLIAYFQAYTNTYAPITYLETVYRQALDCPQIIGISIATRPDCLSIDVLNLLRRLKDEYNKFIWVELGLQTIHEHTANWIRRGYPLSVFTKAVHDLHSFGIKTIVHVILGLPYETKKDMYETICFLNTLPIHGIKLQLLHILKGTDLATLFESKDSPTFHVLTMEEYLEILIHCIELLSPNIVIHRITGDGPKNLLLAPTWSLNKRLVLNTFHQKLKEKNTYQGRYYNDTRSPNSL